MIAWEQLDAERTLHSDAKQVLRITRKQVQDWLEWFGWETDIGFKNELLAHIIALDNVYIPIRQKQIKQAQKKADREAANRQKREQRRHARR